MARVRYVTNQIVPNEVWVGHGLYNTNIANEFRSINEFLNEFPSEIVILHLQGDWNKMNDSLYKKLNNDLNM